MLFYEKIIKEVGKNDIIYYSNVNVIVITNNCGGSRKYRRHSVYSSIR